MRSAFNTPVINIFIFNKEITTTSNEAESASGLNPAYNSHEKIMMKAAELKYNSKVTAVLNWND